MNNNNISSIINRFQKITADKLFHTDISRYIAHIFISIVLGILAGAGAIFFHYLLEQMRYFFEPSNFTRLFNVNRLFIIAIPVIGAIVLATMTKYFNKVAKEKGVLSVIKSIIINDGFIPAKVTLFHLITPIICIGTGAPLGPEGPVAKIGSGIGSLMSQFFKLNRKDMMMYTAAGAGAAISAVFNAPIAGVFFGVEVILLNDLKNRALSAFIISSVVADVLSRAVLGNENIFSIPSYSTGMLGEYPFFLILGVMTGMVSIFYFGLKKSMRSFINEKLKLKNEYIKIIPVAIIWGIILTQYYQLYGIGYHTINSVLNNHISLINVVILLFLQIFFLALYLEAGGYGGTFAPALSIGAFLGYSFAMVTNLVFNTHLDPIAFTLVGMGGILAGINSVPLTAIMLVFEVTNDYQFILPLMLVSIISYLVTVYYNKGSVYTRSLLNVGIDVSKRGEVDLLGRIKVAALMKKDFETVNHKMPFKVLLQIIMHSKYGDVFVVDDKNKFIGVITLKDVRQAIADHGLVDLLIARDLFVPIPTVTEDDPVSLAIQKLEEYDIENIPVVDSKNKKTIIGILTHQDILAAYNTLLEEWETNQFLIDYTEKK